MPTLPAGLRALSLLLLMALALPLGGCEENLDPATPDGALHLLRDAVVQGDVAAVLAYSTQATRDHLAALHTVLKDQRIAIGEKYPDDQRTAARAAFPEGVLEAKDAAELFAALVKPEIENLDRGPGLKFGLTALGAPSISGERATVPTQSGETVEFVLEDGKWKTTAFERALEQNLNRAKLNQQTLEENLKVFEELKRREEAKKKAAEEAAAEE